MGNTLTLLRGPSARVLPSKQQQSSSKAKKTWKAKRTEADIVAHLSSRRQSTQLMRLHGQNTSHALLLQAAISELTSDMEIMREADPHTFIAAMSQLLEERAAPMLLLDAAALAKRRKLPCFDEVEKQLVPLSAVDSAKFFLPRSASCLLPFA